MNVVSAVSIDDAARLVDCSPTELLQEGTSGRLRLYTSIEALLAWKGQTASGLVNTPPASEAPPGAMLGTVRLLLGAWEKSTPFAHTWPDRTVEQYVEAYQTKAVVNDRQRTIVVGFAQRTSAGLVDRARVTVFYQSPPKERALVEFSGDGDLQSARLYASPIKPRGSHSQLRPGDPIPPEYQGMGRRVFSEVVRGRYASNAIAVVADSSDFDSMLTTMARHGVIRGVYKGWL